MRWRTICSRCTRVLRVLWAWTLLCLLDDFQSIFNNVTTANAQETPSINVERWSIDKTFKTNLCDRQQQLNDGDITLDQALKGLNISAAITQYETPTERQYFSLKEDAFGVPRIKRYDPGLYVVVLDEVAERAGFSWRNSFATVAPINPDSDPSDEGKSWTDMLLWEMDVYDISIDYWLKAVSRMKLGVYFVAPFLDSSMILVETPVNLPESNSASASSNNVIAAQVVQNVSIWAFLQPFTTSLWLLSVVALIVTGILYWFLEHLESDLEVVGARELFRRTSSNLLSNESNHGKTKESDNSNNQQQAAVFEHNPCDSMYFAAITFTQHFEFRPKSNTARLLSFSWAFWAVIVGSAYTANLASFLVTQRQIQYSGYTIEDVMDAKDPKSLCVHGATLPDQHLSRVYPNATNIVRKYQEPEIFDALKTGECTTAALPLNMWQLYERDSKHNENCMLKFLGNLIKYNPGSFVTSADTTNTCSSLLGFVLDYHFTQMRSDGTLTRIWEEHLDRVGNQRCDADIGSNDATSSSSNTASSGEDEQMVRLTISDMGGIFLLHAIMSVFALAMAMAGFYARKRQMRMLYDVENQDDLHLVETKRRSTKQTTFDTTGDSAHSRISEGNECGMIEPADSREKDSDGATPSLEDGASTTTSNVDVTNGMLDHEETHDVVAGPFPRRDALARSTLRGRALARASSVRNLAPLPNEEDKELDRRSVFLSANSVRFRNERRASVFNAF